MVAHEVINVAAIDESPSTVGIADSNIYFTDSLDEVIEHLNLIESLGVKNVRLLVPWIFVQPDDPMGGPVDWDLDLNWAKLDQIVREVDRRGMGILGVLQWSPDWATDGTTGSGHPSDVQDFADFAAAVADRYRDEITAYEVWNEPNASFFWNPVDPVEYTNLLKATYTSLKAVNPDITVVGAVVSATLTWGETTMNPVDFVEAMYAAGADGFFDAISFHPYNFDTKFSEQDELDWRELMPLFQVQKIRELMDSHLEPGEEQLKIWISEYGLPTSVVTPEKQLAFITDLLNAWQSFSGGGPIFMYTTKDDMSAIGDERFFGLFDENGNFKGGAQALRDFQRLIDCLDGCSPTNPSNPLASLLQFIQQVVTQVLSFVPNLIAGVVSAVSNLIGSILGGLSGALGATPATAGVGASLRAASADVPGTDGAVTDATDPAALDSDAAAADTLGAEQAPVEVPVTDALGEVPAVEVPVEAPLEELPVEVPVEEPVVEVPVVEEPVVVDPVIEEPVLEEPVLEEPVLEEPIIEEPVLEEPIIEEPVLEEPVAEEPTVEEPTVEEPTGIDPVAAPEAPDTATSDTTATKEEFSKPSEDDADGAHAKDGPAGSASSSVTSPKRGATSVTKSGPRSAERPAATRQRQSATE